MITCHIKYIIDPDKLEAFEHYARLWIPLVNKFGGRHHGYFLPAEGANNMALALFIFPGLAEYEAYRKNSFRDAECLAAFEYAKITKCIISYERSFFRPIFRGDVIMNFVSTKEDISRNIDQFEHLLQGTEKEFAHGLIQRGLCFVAYQKDGEFRFIPSRYVGYRDNTQAKHHANHDKNGRETNPAITKIIGDKPAKDDELESKYRAFILELGIKPHNRPRKYWPPGLFKLSHS